MSFLPTLRLLHIRERFITPIHYAIQVKSYAAVIKKQIKKAAKVEKIVLPVEKDINKLLTYACGTNIYKGGEDTKLKSDSEYPDWLWEIKTEPPQLSDLDPNTKEYWRYVRKAALRRKNRYAKYYGLH